MQPVSITAVSPARLASSSAPRTACWMTAQSEETQPAPPQTRTRYFFLPSASLCATLILSMSAEYFKKILSELNKFKIEVVKTTLDEELALEYGAEGLKACPMHTAGQLFMPAMQNPLRTWQEPQHIYPYIRSPPHLLFKGSAGGF